MPNRPAIDEFRGRLASRAASFAARPGRVGVGRWGSLGVPLLVGLMVAGLGARRCDAAYDAFVRIEGIAGECSDPRHRNEICVLSVSLGGSNPPVDVGGGTGTGRVALQDVAIAKEVDVSSPPLFAAMVEGRRLPTVVIDFVRPESGATFYKVTLTNAVISSLFTSGSGGEATLLEQVSFAFARIEIEYTRAGGEAVTTCWDVVANKRC
jgi:type VI secretion system secreted protein Hcp